MNPHSPNLTYQLGMVHIVKESLYIKFNNIVEICML